VIISSRRLDTSLTPIKLKHVCLRGALRYPSLWTTLAFLYWAGVAHIAVQAVESSATPLEWRWPTRGQAEGTQ